MTHILPHEIRNAYRQNVKALGKDEALRQVRIAVVFKLGHAWYQDRRKSIARELAEIDRQMEEK